jgi:hypothetical protein
LLGKLAIPKVNEEIDETSDIEKKKSIIVELNEIAYTELILSIDVKASSGKVAFLKILEDARPRIIQMAMVPFLGRYSKINMNLFLSLQW